MLHTLQKRVINADTTLIDPLATDSLTLLLADTIVVSVENQDIVQLNWNTEKVTNMNQLFAYCSKLKFIDIRNFTFDNVTNAFSMFSSVPKDCLIIVKGQTEKDWVLTQRSDFTNIKTVEEYENGI